MINFLKENPDLFDETIAISLGNLKPQSWRATWLVGHCIKANDKRIKPYINSILKEIKKKEDGHQREFLKIILKMKLNDKQEGTLFDICISIWEDINKSSSVRIFAFTTLSNLIKKYPELITEIEFLTENHYAETLSPGIRKSFDRIKTELFGY